MYHIEKLRSKEIAELQSIAQELGIKGIKSLDRDSLIYRILDGQAMQNSKAGAPAVVKEENRMNRREHRRNRIHSDASNKVYTANGDKAVKLDKSEPVKPKVVEQPKQQEPKQPVVAVVEPVTAEPVTAPAVVSQEAEKQPKKRGRKPKKEAVAAQLVESNESVAVVAETTTVEPVESTSSKKRGRKPKNKNTEPVQQAQVEVVEQPVEAD